MVDSNKLHARVVEKGLNKKKVADIMGVTYTSLINKFNGKTCWTLDDITKLKDVLEITDDELAVYFFKKEVE